MSKKEKEFMVQFIELYRSFSCLWKVKSKEYSDRNAKSQAYDILIEKMRTVEESANRDTVVKKINSLRTTYRKELKKVLSSEKSGAGADDIYVPHLWYFDLLSFLRDQETPRTTVSNMDDDNESQNSGTHELQFEVDNSSQPATPHSVISDPATPHSVISEPATPHSVTSEPFIPRRISQPSSRAAKRRNDKCDEVLDVIKKRFTTPSNVDDKFTLIGKAWACKLRDLSEEQAIHAEKRINDIFYEAQLGTLNRHCTPHIQQQQHAYLQPIYNEQIQPSLHPGSSYHQIMPLSQTGPSSQHHIQSRSLQTSIYQHTQSAHTDQPPEQADNNSQTVSQYLCNFNPTN